jgi:hypothetical protein
MTSYDHNQTFGLYLAVLKKTDPSPLLPERDEDNGVGSAGPGGGRGGRGGAADSADDARGEPGQQERRPSARTPVPVQIDFDGLQQRILSIPGVPERQ